MLSQVHAPTQSLMSPFGTRAGAVQMEKILTTFDFAK